MLNTYTGLRGASGCARAWLVAARRGSARRGVAWRDSARQGTPLIASAMGGILVNDLGVVERVSVWLGWARQGVRTPLDAFGHPTEAGEFSCSTVSLSLYPLWHSWRFGQSLYGHQVAPNQPHDVSRSRHSSFGCCTVHWIFKFRGHGKAKNNVRVLGGFPAARLLGTFTHIESIIS